MHVCSRKILEIKHLSKFVGEECYFKSFSQQSYSTENFAGWGRKPSYFRAKEYANKYQKTCVTLEDGFIRSLGLGKEGFPPLSLVIDYKGIYFDSTCVSDLEEHISLAENQDICERAKKSIQHILKHGITKYNSKFQSLDLLQFGEENILVVDQTCNDQSIHYAGASPESFITMLSVARKNHPSAKIWVKVHPDVIAKKAKGHFCISTLQAQGFYICSDSLNPIELVQRMDAVYVVSSQLGFEALLCGKSVFCFGVPWYAGWGVTEDQYAPLEILQGRRGQKKSVEHLFACAYFQYARYVSPITQQRCELEDILDLLVINTNWQKKLPKQMVAYGFSRWKRQFLREFLDFPYFRLQFKQYFEPYPDQDILAWGKKAHQLKQKGFKKVWTVEDGFIRSLGLGATLIRPYSLVIDDIGIYYDATQPSRLENLLNTTILDHDQLDQAQKIIDVLVDFNISKYNVGQNKDIKLPKNIQKVLLVIGQVEDDMSVQLGGYDIKTNLGLLQEVRKNNPDAYVIYKPHPDVQSGLRQGKIATESALQYANHIEEEASILQCFKICNEVHTITSLSGFEALLRKIPVYCYGVPFYAGWGLTNDKHKCIRRLRKITLQQLIYISLIQYPIYNIRISEDMRIPLAQPEQVIDHIRQMKLQIQKPKSTLFSRIFMSFRRFQVGKKD
ncbi:capsular polysaccharide biosynthesis protein [Acinetobacter sp. ME22]|uniref:capsular polysaccharide biosynthesis protein n=1 Tax=Acinetobacter sp. ME22 TaxID=2904802 RepID=UPI001EDBE478|nr:capsular polysaccharide biosynthesis protein [Acinetobacter sp. ME22]MCG2574281.1 capsular polysaccharide biosynthesis protein [Acinetobacter sp. ME22]